MPGYLAGAVAAGGPQAAMANSPIATRATRCKDLITLSF